MAWNGRARHGFRGARAVALVEYAIVLGVLVIGMLGVIETLEDETADEVDNQANCISQRPPPPSCQATPLAPTTTTGGSGGPTTTSAGGSGTTETATIEQSTPPFIATSDLPLYDVEAAVRIRDDMANLIPGEIVSIQVTITQSIGGLRNGQFFFIECVTDDNGICTIEFDSRWPEVTELTYDVISIGIDTVYEFDDFTPVAVPVPLPLPIPITIP